MKLANPNMDVGRMIFRVVHTIILEGCTKTFPRGPNAGCFLFIKIFQLHEYQYPTSCLVLQSQNREVFREFSRVKKDMGI